MGDYSTFALNGLFIYKSTLPTLQQKKYESMRTIIPIKYCIFSFNSDLLILDITAENSVTYQLRPKKLEHRNKFFILEKHENEAASLKSGKTDGKYLLLSFTIIWVIVLESDLEEPDKEKQEDIPSIKSETMLMAITLISNFF